MEHNPNDGDRRFIIWSISEQVYDTFEGLRVSVILQAVTNFGPFTNSVTPFFFTLTMGQSIGR